MQHKELVNRLIDLMEQAGINQSTSQVYVFLLTQEYVQSEIIEERFGIQQTKLALQKLLELKIVGIDVIFDKYVAYAITPELAWGSVANEITWRFITSREDFEKARLHTALPKSRTQLVAHARSIIDKIREISKSLYESTPSVVRHQWREAIDKDHLAILLAETILEAKHTILCVTKPPRSSQLALIWESIAQKINDGVAYQRITNLNEIIEHGLYIVQRDIENYGVDLKILAIEEIAHKYYIIDNKFLVVYHLTGIDQSEQIGRVTRERNTIKRYKKRFAKYKQKSIPGLFIVKQLRQESYRILERAKKYGLDDSEIVWLECLINWGVFCNLEEYPLGKMSTLSKKAMELGLVKSSSLGKLVPNYNINMLEIRKVWTQLNA